VNTFVYNRTSQQGLYTQCPQAERSCAGNGHNTQMIGIHAHQPWPPPPPPPVGGHQLVWFATSSWIKIARRHFNSTVIQVARERKARPWPRRRRRGQAERRSRQTSWQGESAAARKQRKRTTQSSLDTTASRSQATRASRCGCCSRCSRDSC
jgi:hypothetical protein